MGSYTSKQKTSFKNKLTSNVQRSCGDAFAQFINGPANVNAIVMRTHPVDGQGHVTKIVNCMQTIALRQWSIVEIPGKGGGGV